jgi:APA family basic amino acid/polyamine antiporter
MLKKKMLNLFDATMIVSGSMIGSAIFIVAADMGRTVGGPGWMMVLWIIAGIMTICAALSYGELAGMYPNAGGQYVYLKEAYGPLTGFLYGWTLFAVIQTGTIAAVGVAFAKYTGVLLPVFSENHVLLTLGAVKITAAQLLGIGSIFLLTWINSHGIRYGQLIARFFTSAKLLSLAGIILLGLFIFRDPAVWKANTRDFWSYGSYALSDSGRFSFTALSKFGLLAALGVGLVGSLFSSDAWNNVTFIAGDIEKPKRNIPLSLAYGTILVIGLYLLVNLAFLSLLPFSGHPDALTAAGKGIMFADKDRVATAAVSQIFGGKAIAIMAVLIIISAIGCNNGLILSGVRVYQTMAGDGLFFKKMARNNRHGEPGYAFWIQFGWASLLCLSGKYGDLLNYVIFAVVLFYILTIFGIFRLRRKYPQAERPYKAFGYPIIPAFYLLMAIAFCIDILFMKPDYTFPGLLIVLIGIPVYYYWKSKQLPAVPEPEVTALNS